jgi:hypothetical protein
VSQAEEKNKALVRWWWEEVWAKGNLAAVDEFIAANYVDHPSLPGLPPGPEGMKQALTAYRRAFPALKATVAARWMGSCEANDNSVAILLT